MLKVAELLAAAAALNSMELKELLVGIQRLEKRRPDEVFELDSFSARLTRVDDAGYLKHHRRSLAIDDDNLFQMTLMHSLFPQALKPQTHARLNLAEIRFVLEHLYGPSSRYYDDYKCSFAFPFALDIVKGDHVFPYLLTVRDYRGWLEFPLRKCVGPDDTVDDIIHPPYESEFSRQEINYFIAYLDGYLRGRYNVLIDAGVTPEPFLHRVESNCVLYGWCDGRFVEERYRHEEEWQEACRRIEAKVKAEKAGQAALPPQDEIDIHPADG